MTVSEHGLKVSGGPVHPFCSACRRPTAARKPGGRKGGRKRTRPRCAQCDQLFSRAGQILCMKCEMASRPPKPAPAPRIRTWSRCAGCAARRRERGLYDRRCSDCRRRARALAAATAGKLYVPGGLKARWAAIALRTERQREERAAERWAKWYVVAEAVAAWTWWTQSTDAGRRCVELARAREAERHREKFRRRYARNPQRERLRVRRYKHSNPTRLTIWNTRRYERLVSQRDGTVTRAAVDRILFSRASCPYCLARLGDDRHLDHIEPLAGGGLHAAFNLVPCCPRCNVSKGSMSFADWIKTLEGPARVSALALYRDRYRAVPTQGFLALSYGQS